jgi:hypothetical protein
LPSVTGSSTRHSRRTSTLSLPKWYDASDGHRSASFATRYAIHTGQVQRVANDYLVEDRSTVGYFIPLLNRLEVQDGDRKALSAKLYLPKDMPVKVSVELYSLFAVQQRTTRLNVACEGTETACACPSLCLYCSSPLCRPAAFGRGFCCGCAAYPCVCPCLGPSLDCGCDCGSAGAGDLALDP